MAGDRETGVCVMQMDAGLDTGPVLSQQTVAIEASETAGNLHDRLGAIGARLVVEVLENPDAVRPTPQPASGVCHAAKIAKSEARIDWTRPAQAVANQINGLSPFPGAFVERNGQRLKIVHVRCTQGEGPPGAVLTGHRVACGTGAVEVLQIQPAGRRAMAMRDWLNGVGDLSGQMLADARQTIDARTQTRDRR